MNESYDKLKAQFDTYYAKAMEAREKNDFYKLVEYLNKAGQCQLDMAKVAPLSQQYDHIQRGKNLKETADGWKKIHPEAFEKASKIGEGSGDTKFTPVENSNTKFDDIIGCEDIKEFIKKQYIYRFDDKYSAVFSDGRGGQLERGLLLFGLPGTGKTMIARAIATEVDAAFFHIKASELVDSLVGNTEKNISALYEEASKYPVSIVFIDELETLIPNRSMDIRSYEASAVTEFLRVLDGFEKEKTAKVITIGASNYPNRIDPAAIRPGRLGAWFRVDLPELALRKQLIESNFKEGYSIEKNTIDYMAKATKGYSGADVVAFCGRIKSSIAELGIKAVDDGASEEEVMKICSTVTKKVVDTVLADSNSSISESSIQELAKFEQNYHFKSKKGSVLSYMNKME